MPDDPMVPLNGAGDPVAPEGTPAPAPGAPQAITLDEASLQQLVGPLQAQNAQSQTQINELQGQLAQALQSIETLRNAEPAIDPTDRVFSDPTGMMQEQARNVIQETLGPILPQFVQSTKTTVESSFRSQVASEFGDDAWDTHFKPIIDARIQAESQANNPLAPTNYDWMSREVNVIKGHKMDELAELRTTTTESRTKTAEEAQRDVFNNLLNTTGLSGGTMAGPIPRGKEPNEEEQKFIDSLARAGRPVTLEELREPGEYGNTVDDYLAHEKKKAKTA